jgi:tRNA G18 (ribose-2'-O)-methylase SpoU
MRTAATRSSCESLPWLGAAGNAVLRLPCCALVRSCHSRRPLPTLTPPPPAAHRPSSYPERPSKSALREQLFGEVLYGVNPIFAALRARRRSPHVLYVQEGATAGKRKDGRAFQVRARRGVGHGGRRLLRVRQQAGGGEGGGRGGVRHRVRQPAPSTTPGPPGVAPPPPPRALPRPPGQACLDMAKEAGVAIKPTSKHDLNLLADNRCACRVGLGGCAWGLSSVDSCWRRPIARGRRPRTRRPHPASSATPPPPSPRPHQGLVLDCSPLEWTPLERLPDTPPDGPPGSGGGGGGGRCPVWLALDEVMDPVRGWGAEGPLARQGPVPVNAARTRHQPAPRLLPNPAALPRPCAQQNLGSLLRSAHCLGADGVLATAKNCAPLSAVVSKASAGALEVMEVHAVKNLPRTLADAAERGWEVVGASGERGAPPLAGARVARPTVLVMGAPGGARAVERHGCRCCPHPSCAITRRLPTPHRPSAGNEGAGLRTNVRRACTSFVRIEMAAPSQRALGGGPGGGLGGSGDDDEEGGGGFGGGGEAEGEGEGEIEGGGGWEDEEGGGGGGGGSGGGDLRAAAAAVDSLNVGVAAGILLHHFVVASRAA